MPFKVFEGIDIGRSLFAEWSHGNGNREITLHEIERDGEMEGEGSVIPE